MPTLAEMRARKGATVARPKSTHTVTLVTGQHLLDEQQRLHEELLDLLAKARRSTEEKAEQTERVRKAGQRALPPRAEEIRNEMADLHGRLSEHQAEVTLVGVLSDGEWLRWKDQHPPREDSEFDHVNHDRCNTSDLFDDLGRFVAQWDGEDVTQADWDTDLADQITFADKRDLVTEVIALYETRLSRAPKSPSSSLGTEPGSTD